MANNDTLDRICCSLEIEQSSLLKILVAENREIMQVNPKRFLPKN